MKDTQLDDLKQFIESWISQTELYVDNKIDDLDVKISARIDGVDNKIDSLDVKLSTKMDNGFAGIAEAIEGINDRLDNNIEPRLVKLDNKVFAT